jgi:hypothetical protein
MYAAPNSTSDDGNRHSSSCKMATILEEWTKDDVHSVVHFLWAKKAEIHCELLIATVNGGNVMALQCVHKWCREFDSGQVNVKDE